MIIGVFAFHDKNLRAAAPIRFHNQVSFRPGTQRCLEDRFPSLGNPDLRSQTLSLILQPLNSL